MHCSAQGAARAETIECVGAMKKSCIGLAVLTLIYIYMLYNLLRFLFLL